jgi:glycosyltransferase involved in cell wall biosynthesis
MSTMGTAASAPHATTDAPVVSVVICTYNRAALLPAAIDDVLAQNDSQTPPLELLVIDNNSTDETRAVVERVAARDERVRYLRETKQGLSHARNAGIAAARAPLIAFTDDDVRVGPDWLSTIVRTVRAHPGVSVVGGRVLPVWPAPPPPWLTAEHWGPLALVDYGEHPVRVDAGNPLCLVGANLAIVRSAFDLVGGFAADVQRVRDSVGSSEDHEFLLRLFGAGGFGIYDPGIVIHADVQPDRLERAYHRRWHTGHGHFHALMRPEYLERSNTGRLFDVPAHMYRSAARDAAAWARARLRRDDAVAFSREVRLRFFRGFFRTRRRQFLALPREEQRLQWRTLARGVFGRRAPTAPETAVAPEGQR